MDTQHRKIIVFIHIPKAAGSTLSKILSRQYNTKSIYRDYQGHPILEKQVLNKIKRENPQNFELEVRKQRFAAGFLELPESRQTAIEMYQGHVGFGIHAFLPHPCSYITMLRDPIDRIISHYYYVLQHPDHYLHEQVVSQKMTLEDYAASSLTPEIDNSQTKYLAGLEESLLNYGEYSSDLLETAKQNIESNFVAIGLTERFDESMLLFQKKLGWRVPLYMKTNVTRGRLKKNMVSDGVLQVIKEHNVLDIELYKYAQKIFEKQINEYGNYFQRDFDRFIWKNKQYALMKSVGSYFGEKLKKAKRFLITTNIQQEITRTEE